VAVGTALGVGAEGAVEAGEQGGLIVGEGTPEQLAAMVGSHTGRFLRTRLGMKPKASNAKKRKPRAEEEG
jgi:hypothetical protein